MLIFMVTDILMTTKIKTGLRRRVMKINKLLGAGVELVTLVNTFGKLETRVLVLKKIISELEPNPGFEERIFSQIES